MALMTEVAFFVQLHFLVDVTIQLALSITEFFFFIHDVGYLGIWGLPITGVVAAGATISRFLND